MYIKQGYYIPTYIKRLRKNKHMQNNPLKYYLTRKERNIMKKGKRGQHGSNLNAHLPSTTTFNFLD